MSNYENNYNQLCQWLHISPSNFKIKDISSITHFENRIIVANRKFNYGDILVEIPDSQLLDNDWISASQKKKFPFNSINSHLALYLLNNPHPWRKYLQIVPQKKSFQTHALFLTPSQKKILQPTILFNAKDSHYNLSQYAKYIRHDLNLLQKAGYNKNQLSQFLYYRLIVGSRVFSYQKKGSKYNGLVPWVDLLNHNSKPNTKWFYDNTKNKFVLQATRDILPSHEITDTYGSKDNLQMLLYYNFYLPNNPRPLPLTRPPQSLPTKELMMENKIPHDIIMLVEEEKSKH